MPLLVVLLSSCLVWIIDKSDITTIFRGISGCFIYTNWLSCALAAGAVLYVFGKNGIWYNLAAIVASNLLMILTIIMSDGLGTFMKEFFRAYSELLRQIPAIRLSRPKFTSWPFVSARI